jgi:hypothetical protein
MLQGICRASGSRFVLLLAIAHTAQASAGTVTKAPEDFGTFSGRQEFGTYLQGTAHSVKSSSTGFRWSAYSNDCAFALRNDAATSGRTVVESCGGVSMIGSYVYTFFDTGTDVIADKLLDHLQTITVAWNAVDSTVTGAHARIMIRAVDGQWYLSDSSIPITNQTSAALAVSPSLTWTSITAPGTTLDNANDDNTGPLTFGAPGLHPDLSTVTGGGVFFSDFTNETAGSVRLSNITFKGVTWEMESLAAVVNPIEADANIWADRPRLRLYDTPLPKDDTLVALRNSGALSTHIQTLATRGLLPIVVMTDTTPTTTDGQLAMAGELQSHGLDIEAFITALPRRECDMWPDEQYWIEPSTAGTPQVPASNIGTSSFGLCPRGDKWPTFAKHDVMAGATKIRDKMFGLSEAGFSIAALWTDDERQPFPWNGAISSQQVAKARGYYNGESVNLTDFEAFKAYSMTLRRDLQTQAYLGPVRDLTYDAVWGNYDSYASSAATPFFDKNGVSYPELSRVDGEVTMPSSYANTRILKAYLPNRTAITQSEADAIYLTVMLKTFSTNSANVTPTPYGGPLHSNLHVVPYVSRYVPDVTEAPYGALGMSQDMYREFLRHVWLRGADSMFIFDAGITNKNDRFEPPLYGQTPFQAFDQLEGARAVYDEVLTKWRFLNEGEPMSFSVPAMSTPGVLNAGVLWSGLRKADGSCLVRAIAIGVSSTQSATISGCGGDVTIDAPPEGCYYIIENGNARPIH